MDGFIVQEIAKYLSEKEVCKCQCVSKEWKRLFKKCELYPQKPKKSKMCGWPPRPRHLTKRISEYLDLRIYLNY